MTDLTNIGKTGGLHSFEQVSFQLTKLLLTDVHVLVQIEVWFLNNNGKSQRIWKFLSNLYEFAPHKTWSHYIYQYIMVNILHTNIYTMYTYHINIEDFKFSG